MNKFLKTVCLVLALCSFLLLMSACAEEPITDKAYYDYKNSDTGYGEKIRTIMVSREIDSMKVEDFVASEKESDYVLIKIKDYGDIIAVLRSDVAPVSVANFKKLVKTKFFDGTIFHRVIENFMIQGGGCIVVPNEKGDGTVLQNKKSDSIYGEFSSNGFDNNLYHVRGVLSMARSDNPNSASSQFFIIHQDSPHLNGDYAAFGYVLAGMDVVDKIATCQVFSDANNMPVVDVVIESVTFVEVK